MKPIRLTQDSKPKVRNRCVMTSLFVMDLGSLQVLQYLGKCPFISTPNEFTLNSFHAVWLENDALKDNPKIEIVPGDDGEKKYEFKPAIPVKDRKSLLQYLDKQETEGLGNIYVRTDRLHSTPVDTMTH